jgi:hypothetical protein
MCLLKLRSPSTTLKPKVMVSTAFALAFWLAQ